MKLLSRHNMEHILDLDFKWTLIKWCCFMFKIVEHQVV